MISFFPLFLYIKSNFSDSICFFSFKSEGEKMIDKVEIEWRWTRGKIALDLERNRIVLRPSFDPHDLLLLSEDHSIRTDGSFLPRHSSCSHLSYIVDSWLSMSTINRHLIHKWTILLTGYPFYPLLLDEWAYKRKKLKNGVHKQYWTSDQDTSLRIF